MFLGGTTSEGSHRKRCKSHPSPFPVCVLTLFQMSTLLIQAQTSMNNRNRLSLAFPFNYTWPDHYTLFLWEAFCDSQTQLGHCSITTSCTCFSLHKPRFLILHWLDWLSKLRSAFLSGFPGPQGGNTASFQTETQTETEEEGNVHWINSMQEDMKMPGQEELCPRATVEKRLQ